MNNVDNIRMEQYRQIKKEIRGSKEYLIAGIDVAKSKHYAFWGDAMGKTILKRLIFENNLEGFNKLRAYEDSLKTRYGFQKMVYSHARLPLSQPQHWVPQNNSGSALF